MAHDVARVGRRTSLRPSLSNSSTAAISAASCRAVFTDQDDLLILADRARSGSGRSPRDRRTRDHSSEVTIICSGASGSTSGPGIFLMTRSKSGCNRARALRRIVRRDSPPGRWRTCKGNRGRIVGTQFDEQVEHFRKHFAGPGVGAIDLIDHDDRLQAALEGLFDARIASAAAALRRRRPGSRRRRPSTALARPRRRSRRGPACR